MIKKFISKLLNKKFSSGKYWENRYAAGGNSGDGSYGRLSEFKARFLNDFIEKNHIQYAVEIGCGDGHQLSIINYPKYLGLDVSQTVIDQCRNKFAKDSSKSFKVYQPFETPVGSFAKADLALSLDVIYHIVETKTYQKYLEDLFDLSSKYVVIYSTNFDLDENIHVLHRKFTDDVTRIANSWYLDQHIPNPYPGNGEQESMADFFVFKRKEINEER